MRTERFTFLCTKSEREAISTLAKFYRRSQSDLLRFLIVEEMDDLSVLDEPPVTKESDDISLTQHNPKRSNDAH